MPIQEATRLRAKDYQRTPVRIVNTVLRGLNACGVARIHMDPETLMADASGATGLTDFGDTRFLQPFHALIKSTNEEADLNPLGRWLAKTNVDRLLKGRLQVQELWRRHPEILARDLQPPIVVVGLARSGTTRLHRLLAADARFAHLKSWESVYPVPNQDSFDARKQGKIDPRITSLDQALKAVLYLSPQMNAVHPLGTMEVEEEVGLLQYAFATQLFEIINGVPSFAQRLMTHDQTFAYEYMRDLLKTISWFRDDPKDMPWVLKSPQHLQDLDALLAVFPDAKIICPHRDPIKAVGSMCSTAWNSLVRDNDNVDPHTVGKHWFEKIESMLHKNLRDREAFCPSANQYDVLYADITADWRAAIEGIYKFLQIPLTDTAVTGMQNWLDSNLQHKHGAHRYSLEQFGLDVDEVDNRLMFYRKRFNIPYEHKNPHLNTTP